jgi:hypothetical protein
VRLRHAFEHLRDCVTSTAQEKVASYDQDWFYAETGLYWTTGVILDRETQEEVVDAFQNLSPGGRDPGEWELARHVTERHLQRGNNNDSSDNDNLLQISAGTSSVLSKRRRRRY